MSCVDYHYDVIIVGAGHAGCEAALAASRLGAATALLTMNCDSVGQMSCNPAIGGVAKGQIVREIDALGGAMGKIIDATGIQFRMLNRSKGPAMWSPRAQADKKAYQADVKFTVEQQANLTLRQETVEDLVVEWNSEHRDTASEPVGRVTGITCKGGVTYHADAVILTTGTFLQAIMHTGESKADGGRAGEGTTKGLSKSLKELGFDLTRFKTGTPPRINGRTIDFAALEEQAGDKEPIPFSYSTKSIDQPQMACHITFTNKAIHERILANLDRAPMYSGQIQSTGPRYCPSIEDKVVRFSDKDEHQIFLEPEGRRTLEYYCNGISTSLPRDIQDEIIHLIPGLEKAEIMRYGYAVEYDFAPPTQLRPTLETKRLNGLFFAGQINGTTGYEEAAGQGLLAGANAALKLQTKPSIVLSRDEAYLGVLIDDLVTKGADEPYRMFTSRAEYRLLLRQDNADRRLTPKAHAAGLIAHEEWESLERKEEQIRSGLTLLRDTWRDGKQLETWLRRPEMDWDEICKLAPQLRPLVSDPAAQEQVVIEVKYAGYINRQMNQIEKFRRNEDKSIPGTLDYSLVPHLRMEAKEKLQRIKPANFGQASRISGISPSDLAVLMTYLQAPKRMSTQAENTSGTSGSGP